MSRRGWFRASGVRRLAVFTAMCLAPAVALAQDAVLGGGEVVATVGDRAILLRDVEREWQKQNPQVYARLRQQIYDGRKRAVDALITAAVLEQEAARTHASVQQLNDALARSAAPSDAEIQQTYEQSPAASQGISLEQARPSIAAYLTQRKLVNARTQFLDRARRDGTVLITSKLDLVRETIPVEASDPTIGPAAAPVQIVEYSDFECPFCLRAAPALKRLAEQYGDRVRLAWKNFPLSGHQSAQPAAEASACAADQGQFWAYHDILFKNQQALLPSDLKRYAVTLGLDVNAFNACLDSGRHRDHVKAQADEAKGRGVSATPTVFINGRMVQGFNPGEYDRIVTEELERTAAPAARTPQP